MWSIPTIRRQPSWQKSSTAAKRPTGAANCSSRSSHPWRTFYQDLQLQWINCASANKSLKFHSGGGCFFRAHGPVVLEKLFKAFLPNLRLVQDSIVDYLCSMISSSSLELRQTPWSCGGMAAMLAMRISLARWGRFVRDPRNCCRDPGGRHGVICKFSFFHQEYTWCWECRPHLTLPKYFEGKMRLNICMYEYFFNEMPCICGNARFCQGHDMSSDIINLISKELQIKSKINYFYFKFIFSCN